MAQTKVKLISDGVIVQGNLHASHGITTAHIGEGSNLYYTDARVGSYLSTNSFATESYVGTQIANLVDSSPSALNTLNELAAALGDDANFSTTVTNSIALKAPLASPSFTGNATFTGSITATSANLTTSGTVLSLDRTGGATALIELKIGGTIEGYLGATTTKSLVVFNESAAEKFSVSNAGNATFAGDVSITGGDLTLGTDSIASNINGVGDVLIINVDSNTGGGAGANIQLKTAGTTQLTINNSSATFTGDVGMATGHSSGKFAVMSTSVHGSYDFYNNGTSYFNGAVTIDSNITQTGATIASFHDKVGVGTQNPYAFDTTATKLHVKNPGSSGSVVEVARFEGSPDASGSGGTIRLGTSNDRGIYFEGGRTATVPYGKIGLTEYNGAKTPIISLFHDSATTFAGNVSAQGFHVDAASLQSFQDFQSKPIDTDSGLFTVGGHGMALGYSRAVSLWSTTDGVYRSWVGTNLRWDGTNYKRASNHQNNNWGNIAGILFTGNSAATGAAMSFIIDPPENASGSGEATIGTSLPAGYTALTINNDLSATFAGKVGIGTTSLSVISGASGTLNLGSTSASLSGGILYQSNGTAVAYHYYENSNFLYQNAGAYGHIFLTGNTTERMRIDSSGKVGIGTGTDTPENRLHVRTNTTDASSQLMLQNGSTGDASIKFNISGQSYVIGIDNSDSNKFKIAGSSALGTTDRFVIDSNGAVGIGTTSPGATLQIGGGSANVLQKIWGSGTAGIQIFTNSPSTESKIISLEQYFSNEGYLGLYYNGAEKVRFRANDASYISGGLVFIGGTSNLGYTSHNIQLSAPSGYACIVRNSDTSTTNGSVIQFNRAETTATTGGYCVIYRQGDTSSGTNRWIVFANGNIQNTNNSYGSLSDERKKENIVDATPKLDDLMKVKVRNFNLKGEETKQIGVVAQELEEVFPGMIDESKTPDSEDETLYKGVKYSVFVPMLIKAVQELKADNDSLKARIETLENK